jgi:hypothetical protein
MFLSGPERIGTIPAMPAAIPVTVGLQAAAFLAANPFLMFTRMSNILPAAL